VKPVVRVVGLGPGDLAHVTRRAFTLISESPVVRLRTRQHPGARHFDDVESYDEWYDRADDFETLYEAIVDDLVALATKSPTREVVFAVPGSPTVAERTVELLRERDEVTTITEPAVSVIDVVCATLGRDPMSVGLRVTDALGSSERLVGPGPLLILQTYSPEVLASVADRLLAGTEVTVLHHLGLDDEVVTTLGAFELAHFAQADHLTSLWVEGIRGAGAAMDDLVALMKRLRAECPWDQEQSHASLTRHLLEEAYETLDALETLVRVDAEGRSDGAAVDHVQEELGDLLFQIVFHAELFDEEGQFDLAAVADAVRHKLIGRHPHVFGDVKVTGSNDVATLWEALKQREKGRESITDGVAWQLPALTLYTKLLRKAVLVDVAVEGGEASRQCALDALRALDLDELSVRDAQSSSVEADAWGDALSALVTAAQFAGVDLEGVLRERAMKLRDAIREKEELA
jgi:tetrapyrrole methylase family protein/MazG family protein